MQQQSEDRRLFFGLQVIAPWPQDMPQGRLLDEAHRHMTLAFLGEVPYHPLLKLLEQFPAPSFRVGFAGIFDACLFLPPRHPNVVAWQGALFDPKEQLRHFQGLLMQWLRDHKMMPKNSDRPWLPHVTLCRRPFNEKEWSRAFQPLPFIATGIHLYESVGNLKYESRWEYPLVSPFDEISHTADIAFHIHGEDLQEIHHNAETALAFQFPALIPYLQPHFFPATLDEIIMSLNDIISKADADLGCPFKAVSFHGTLEQQEQHLTWEMIVDV